MSDGVELKSHLTAEGQVIPWRNPTGYYFSTHPKGSSKGYRLCPCESEKPIPTLANYCRSAALLPRDQANPYKDNDIRLPRTPQDLTVQRAIREINQVSPRRPGLACGEQSIRWRLHFVTKTARESSYHRLQPNLLVQAVKPEGVYDNRLLQANGQMKLNTSHAPVRPWERLYTRGKSERRGNASVGNPRAPPYRSVPFCFGHID
ncbi:membrane protein [Anopheles sinensis]|uniref:Membrane protein n=1 Tax=Anopheles sinensis TaxID=74873 RepID=A0A084VNN6_ANOSI|nr:membrane protein [Anopheles sinensis]